MVHAKNVAEARARRKSRYAKRARSFDGDSSKNWIEIKDKPGFKKRVSSQVASKFLKDSGDRVKCTNSPTDKPTCGNFGNKNYCYCLKRKDNCFVYGKSGHKVRDFPNVSGQAQASGSNKAPNKNRFYALLSRGE